MEDVLAMQAKDRTTMGQRKRCKDGETLLGGVKLFLNRQIKLPTSKRSNSQHPLDHRKSK